MFLYIVSITCLKVGTCEFIFPDHIIICSYNFDLDYWAIKCICFHYCSNLYVVYMFSGASLYQACGLKFLYDKIAWLHAYVSNSWIINVYGENASYHIMLCLQFNSMLSCSNQVKNILNCFLRINMLIWFCKVYYYPNFIKIIYLYKNIYNMS